MINENAILNISLNQIPTPLAPQQFYRGVESLQFKVPSIIVCAILGQQCQVQFPLSISRKMIN
jgi:hypothetical protein